PLSSMIPTVVSAVALTRTHKTIASIGVMLRSVALTLPAQIGGPEVAPAVNHDTSPPLRDMKVPPRSDVPRERPLRLIPGQAITNQPDPVVQASAGPLVGLHPGLCFA